jgi:hypothetical protein
MHHMQHNQDHLNTEGYSRCRKNGKCIWNYPHSIHPTTTLDEFGKPIYRRRTAQDAWTVPYNPLLLMEWGGHLNFEIAFTVNVFLYLYKYIFKGGDKGRFSIVFDGDVDEIDDYIKGRYLSCVKATYRILGYDISRKEPGVKRLPVHLPGQNRAQFFRADDSQSSMSLLLRYFRRPEALAELKYVEYFEQYSLIKDDNTPLQSGEYQETSDIKHPSMRIRSRKKDLVARIETVRPGTGELFYLRALLICKSAISFEHLRTIDDHIYPTFSEAARALGLFQNQNEAVVAMEDAIADFKSPAQLRFLFAHLIIEGGPAPEMWSKFSSSLIEDYVDFQHLPQDIAIDKALCHISDLLGENGKSLEQFALPLPARRPDVVLEEITAFTTFQAELNRDADSMISKMNEEQLSLFHHLLQLAVNPQDMSSRLCFLEGKAGRGKSFVVEALCMKLRALGKVVLIAGSTALSVCSYPRGRTIHNLFKITVDTVCVFFSYNLFISN